jgi:transcriptional regulator with XRE-family HTH domain
LQIVVDSILSYASSALRSSTARGRMMISGPTPRRGRRTSDTPHPVDVNVGSRVRLRRNMLGLSQSKLGDAIGLTFQQVQKYERGTNRISASSLYMLSRALDVPVSFFFDDVDPVRAPAIPGGFSEPPTEPFESDPLRRRETVELVDAYYAIHDAAVRRRLLELARAFAGEPEKPRGPLRRTKSARGRRRG